HQRKARNTRRESQIIFYTGGGPSLSAKCAAIENQDRKPFRPRIDGGGKSSRPSAHDRDVIDTVRIDRPDEPNTTSEHNFAGIAQQLSGRTQNDRQLRGIDMKAFD